MTSWGSGPSPPGGGAVPAWRKSEMFYSTQSEVVSVKLKEGLGMLAGGALRRRLQSFDHASAIPALPERFLGSLENGFVLNRFDEYVVSPLVPLFDRGNLLERLCHVLKALLGGLIRKSAVERGPLVSLPCSMSAFAERALR